MTDRKVPFFFPFPPPRTDSFNLSLLIPTPYLYLFLTPYIQQDSRPSIPRCAQPSPRSTCCQWWHCRPYGRLVASTKPGPIVDELQRQQAFAVAVAISAAVSSQVTAQEEKATDLLPLFCLVGGRGWWRNRSSGSPIQPPATQGTRHARPSHAGSTWEDAQLIEHESHAFNHEYFFGDRCRFDQR